MAMITLGTTGLIVEKNGFGALPIQRTDMDTAVDILRSALDGGMNFFDTARAYSDSEEKLGRAFSGMRDSVVIATKTQAEDAATFEKHLNESLRALNTDYIDLYQFHAPAFCPRPGGQDGLYDAMQKARAQGKVRFIGITNHRMDVALQAVDSGLYETLQFPFSYLCTDDERSLVRLCRARNMGFIAMKALSGGLITNARAACAWMYEQLGVVPIWGIQRQSELAEFLRYIKEPPALDDAALADIAKDRVELQGDFCRGCGYCMPCPQDIQINMCARMSLLIRRAPTAVWLGDRGQKMMSKVPDCKECGLCSSRCPYQLDTPALLKKNYQDYMEQSQ